MYVRTHVHCENKFLIQSFTLMRSAIMIPFRPYLHNDLHIQLFHFSGLGLVQLQPDKRGSTIVQTIVQIINKPLKQDTCNATMIMGLYYNIQVLGECRTLWGEREQAKHCMKSQHTGYAWHIAKTKFVTINSIVMLGQQSLSWSSTTHWSHFSTTTQLLWLFDTQAIKVN